ncbi:P-loop containing nucleoside triphosphate hydrolase protein [Leptodontidium sp. 2 PMI_412]|nr:P-loop containing nucleoside triphosphate hydrolase protein [Leptodontidium sp. 2 PMI_412]
MRLLEVVGPDEYSLVQAPTHNTLPYAILSHTWTEGQEVTYQDLITGAENGKSGYDKIKFCAEQAATDGFQYFWVDTCCINKSDSTELTTAINSMFRWYRNARKCYVYLEDVSTAGCIAATQINQNRWKEAFRGSRWFTRGWTLQELIAPAIVEFFSKEGNLLGDKASLESTIHEITRIPTRALQGNPFSDFSVSERQSWVLQRQTTEEEDLVYCLLSLCGVSMPPMYGEGKTAALKRLEMTIEEFSKDRSSPKDQTGREVPFIVPFERNSRFTSRQVQLAEVEEKLLSGGSTRTAIVGLGGVSKTQLALELAYQIRDKYRNCVVIWIPATNVESLYQAYLDVARQLGIAGCEDTQVDVKRLIKDHLSNESAGQWLLVFDNADDINMWTGQVGSKPGSERLIDYLPKSKHGCVLFTSRDKKTAVKLTQQNVVQLTEMGEDIAMQLLQKCLIDPGLVDDSSETKTLLQELTYLPLAIVQAAAYINENGIAFANYLSLLANQEEEVIELLSEEFDDHGRYRNVKNPVATTWLISFQQIRHRDPLAADYLAFMCCIDPKDIPQSLLPPGPSRKKELEAIGTLDAYSFVSKRPADQALDLHRLVHLATRNWLRKEDLLAQWTESVVERLEDLFPDDDHNNRSVWRTYLPHARCALESNLGDRDRQSRLSLSWRYAICLYANGLWNEAEAALVEVLDIKRRDLGADDPSTLTTIAKLASTYSEQGRWDVAEELQQQVMETSKTKLGADHPDTLSSMANLASTFWNQGRWEEAEKLDVQVMETRKTKLGADHPSTLTSMGNLATTFGN